MEFALREGHEVHLVYFSSQNWSDETSQQILEKLPQIKTYRIDRSWWLFRYKIGQVLRQTLRYTGNLGLRTLRFRSHSHSDRSWYLHRFLKHLDLDPDLVIGHMLSSFWPAYKMAKRSGARLGLDVEDFHAGEDFPKTFTLRNELRNREYLMRTLLPIADYSSYASPGIERLTERVCKGKLLNNPKAVIQNSFWSEDFALSKEHKPQDENTVRLIWFSQNINRNRGLEELLRALDYIDFQGFKLTLYGHLNEEFYSHYLKKYKDNIDTRQPVPQAELHKQLDYHDVGLALERNDTDINKKVAVSNKIWAYLQAGLYVLASDTAGQEELMSYHRNHGLCSSLERDHLVDHLLQIRKSLSEIRETRTTRFDRLLHYSFDRETEKLRQLWKVINH